MVAQRLTMCVVAAVAAGTMGCQLDENPSGAEVRQAVVGVTCTAEMPAAVIYAGQPLPIAGPGQIWVTVPAEAKDGMLAALVDTTTASILAMIRIPPDMGGGFLSGISPFLVVFPGHPPPPPPVSPLVPAFNPPVSPSWLVFVGQRAIEAFAASQDDAKSCSPRG